MWYDAEGPCKLVPHVYTQKLLWAAYVIYSGLILCFGSFFQVLFAEASKDLMTWIQIFPGMGSIWTFGAQWRRFLQQYSLISLSCISVEKSNTLACPKPLVLFSCTLHWACTNYFEARWWIALRKQCRVKSTPNKKKKSLSFNPDLLSLVLCEAS